MPLLEDARALLEVDRERVKLARETAQIALEHSEVLADAEDRAERLARLGDQERPKALQFIKEAATFLPQGQGQPTPGTPSSSTPRSSGGSSGAGAATAGGRGRDRQIYNTTGTGTGVSYDWVQTHCTLTTIKIPKPGSPVLELVDIAAWDCSEVMPTRSAEDAIFVDPDAWLELVGTRSLSRTGGSGARGGGANPRAPIGSRNTQGIGESNPFQAATGGSASTGPTPPTTGEKLIERAVTSGLREVVKELRAGGDLGLQIRRNGGL